MERKVTTTGEIAQHCGVNFRTVIRWIQKGHLRAYQLPGRGDNRVEVLDFVNFLREHDMPIPEAFQGYLNRILVVDDDPAMASNIHRVLRRAGYEAAIASNGFEAGTLADSFSPRLMTLDLSMPDLSGLEVLRIIRSSDRLRHIKVLVVSAMPQGDLEKALSAGADDVLEKPFHNAELVAKVAELIGESAAG